MVKVLRERLHAVSAFARASGLSRDTVRFYVRRGLLTPLAGNKCGSNPYQVFTGEHVQMARTIRMAQSLGFSLREIAALKVEDLREGRLVVCDPAPIPADEMQRTYDWLKSWGMLEETASPLQLINTQVQDRAHQAAE